MATIGTAVMDEGTVQHLKLKYAEVGGHLSVNISNSLSKES